MWRGHSCLPRPHSWGRIGGTRTGWRFHSNLCAADGAFQHPRKSPETHCRRRGAGTPACRVGTPADALAEPAPADAFIPIFAPPRGLPTLVLAASALLPRLGGPRTGGRFHSHLCDIPRSFSLPFVMLPPWQRQSPQQSLKIRRRLALHGNHFSRPRVNTLNLRRMQSHSGNPALRPLRLVVLPVAYHGVAHRGELHPDLILQSRHQRDPYQRSGLKRALDGIPKFRTSRLGITFRAQSLKHSFPPKVVNQRPFPNADPPPNNGEILPHRSVAQKLSNQCVPVRLRFCKQKHARCITVDPMHHQRPLSSPCQRGGKKREGGRSIRALHRHGRESSRLVDGHHRIVFVQHDELPRVTRLPPILLFRRVTALVWRLFHLLMADRRSVRPSVRMLPTSPAGGPPPTPALPPPYAIKEQEPCEFQNTHPRSSLP